MILDIDSAITDPRLLGAALGDLSTWRNWRVILKAAFALPLSESELYVFSELAGGREAPKSRVAELWIAAGRRGGKTRMASAIGVYLSAFAENAQKLALGETGHVLALAPSKDQAALIKNYASGHFAASAVLRNELESESANEIRLRGNIVLGIHSNSFRTVRGRTLLAAILEEVAFFRDETSANPDLETYRAILPALATTNGMLIGISSPYRKTGLLFQKHRDHFGVDGDILVIQAPTEKLNPTIDKRIIARSRENDPAAALAEWDAEFRNDLSSFLDDDLIDSAIDRSRPMELPFDPRHRYFAFTDASAGRKDHFTAAIAHKEGGRVILDALRGHRPPFDPQSVAFDLARLAKAYGCQEVVGDNFAGDWVASAFRSAGVGYRRCDTPRSGLYLEMLPLFTQGSVEIPNHPQLIRELRLLERRTSRSGKDHVDHANNGSDDYSNSLAGVAFLCSRSNRRVPIAQVGRASFTAGGSMRASFS